MIRSPRQTPVLIFTAPRQGTAAPRLKMEPKFKILAAVLLFLSSPCNCQDQESLYDTTDSEILRRDRLWEQAGPKYYDGPFDFAFTEYDVHNLEGSDRTLQTVMYNGDPSKFFNHVRPENVTEQCAFQI